MLARRRVLGLVALLAVTAAGCGGAAKRPTVPSASGDTSPTVWLCKPGAAGDPCLTDETTTIVSGNGSRQVEKAQPATASRFDCFYVYPTVSLQKAPNANLKIQPPETATAVEQASRFSQVCRVWAPMYRQQTVAGLLDLTSYATTTEIAFKSLLAGWRDYLRDESHGRPFILIGHSQGAAMLIRLIRSQIDANPALRKRLVSAIILGGNVQVPTGKVVGGSFAHVPACQTATQTGCVIAYSSFPAKPPTVTLFGRAGTGVSLLAGQTAAAAGTQVLCVNPASLTGGEGSLQPYFTTSVLPPPGKRVTTRWVAYPGLYRASCESSGGDTWLQVTDIGSTGDTRPRVTERDGAEWGFHIADVNLALGNLVADVRGEEAAYKG
jgi:hypothetical protein